MNIYYYIPLMYENLFKQQVDEWVSNNWWTIITGVYREGNYIQGNSVIKNYTQVGDIIDIPYSIQGSKEWYELKGFILEVKEGILSKQQVDLLHSLGITEKTKEEIWQLLK